MEKIIKLFKLKMRLKYDEICFRKKFKIIKLDMGPNYIIASTKSQHKEILKNPESSAELIEIKMKFYGGRWIQ